MRAKLMIVVLILLAFVSMLTAADKSPQQILGGKPAATSSGPGRYYDGHGSFAGRSSTAVRAVQQLACTTVTDHAGIFTDVDLNNLA